MANGQPVMTQQAMMQQGLAVQQVQHNVFSLVNYIAKIIHHPFIKAYVTKKQSNSRAF